MMQPTDQMSTEKEAEETTLHTCHYNLKQYVQLQDIVGQWAAAKEACIL